jgi:hypothetical protein
MIIDKIIYFIRNIIFTNIFNIYMNRNNNDTKSQIYND